MTFSGHVTTLASHDRNTIGMAPMHSLGQDD